MPLQHARENDVFNSSLIFGFRRVACPISTRPRCKDLVPQQIPAGTRLRCGVKPRASVLASGFAYGLQRFAPIVRLGHGHAEDEGRRSGTSIQLPDVAFRLAPSCSVDTGVQQLPSLVSQRPQARATRAVDPRYNSPGRSRYPSTTRLRPISTSPPDRSAHGTRASVRTSPGIADRRWVKIVAPSGSGPHSCGLRAI